MEYNRTRVSFLKLKVKVKSLTEEARIIRQLERCPIDVYCELHNHRVWNVRNEARATQLAVAFMKGKKYKTIEPICKDDRKLYFTITPRVVAMLKSYYHHRCTEDMVCAWLAGTDAEILA